MAVQDSRCVINAISQPSQDVQSNLLDASIICEDTQANDSWEKICLANSIL